MVQFHPCLPDRTFQDSRFLEISKDRTRFDDPLPLQLTLMSSVRPPPDLTGPSGESPSPADSPIEIYRHSSAHLLAAAVTELFPDTQCGIGPPTDDGFFYDFLTSKAVHA
jgi:hypothetical protein